MIVYLKYKDCYYCNKCNTYFIKLCNYNNMYYMKCNLCGDTRCLGDRICEASTCDICPVRIDSLNKSKIELFKK